MTIELEPAACCVCGSAPGVLVRRAQSWLDEVTGTYEVRACEGCGLWITSPRPLREHLQAVYPGGYHRRVIEAGPPPAAAEHRGRLLDLGCGVGNYMAIARCEGWSCLGVEISEEAAAIARSRGFDVIVGDAAEVELGEDEFDHIRCAHVLEHLPEPEVVLARLARAVKPSGEIMVLLPNRRSATSMLFRRYWFHLDVPRHLFHFDPADVARLAAAAGLRVRSARHTGSPSGLLGSIDCVLATRTDSRLRLHPQLRRAAQVVTVPLARLRLADVVEYRLGRQR